MKQTLSEESRSIISDFFVRSAETVLYAFVDKASGTVSVSKSPPAPGRCDELVQYFFKDSDAPLAGVPTVHQLQHSVFFGYLRMDNLAADLTSLVGQLGLQQVRNNKTWPTSITKDLVGTLERYMATMMDAANQSEGKTILYVPQDDLSQVEVCAADKDLCQRLEATVIHWTRQIKGLISGGQGKPIEDSPLGEIELWRRRCNDFSGLETQLKAPAVQQVVTVLELAKSSYLEPLQKLAMSIEIQTHEAKDNFQMLAPLVDPCTRLTKCQLTDMPSILEEVMCLVRAIWANSRFLNTSDSINGLLRKV
jgi:dynein heavy chain